MALGRRYRGDLGSDAANFRNAAFQGGSITDVLSDPSSMRFKA
jgi:hypothetical protein